MTEHAPIVIVGRFDPSDATHTALRDAILHAETQKNVVVSTRWVGPDELDRPDDALGRATAAVIAPSSAHARLELVPEILDAIGWLRRRHVPTLAIESGFQHMTIEWARAVLAHPDANARTFDESTEMPIWDAVDPHPRPNLEGLPTRTVKIHPVPGTKCAAAYGDRTEADEQLRPLAAFNPDFLPEFEKSGMIPGATAYWWGRTLVCAMESTALPFWVGTAFLPPLTSRHTRPHPLIAALLDAAVGR